MDFHGTFATEEGKRVLERISKFCHENDSTFIVNRKSQAHGTEIRTADPYISAFSEGQRSVIIYIRELLKKKPDERKQEQAKSQKE